MFMFLRLMVALVIIQVPGWTELTSANSHSAVKASRLSYYVLCDLNVQSSDVYRWAKIQCEQDRSDGLGLERKTG
ncbi:hypothetical protein B0T21DRAFT_366468 [Apiosordaria backusii]|uniref:Secreted protein n=1 Tax=Apiosordaria backusii TaxID=314023 RepID=A0AA40EHL4_9PEZI|nr:hypothetical protein B0T21DRAFT_366468 [Apiosordaria backusii]